MPVKPFNVHSLIYLSLLAVGFATAGFGRGSSYADELNATERKQAVQSFRDYQALFKNQKVELEVRFFHHVRPAQNSVAEQREFRIVATNGWMYTEEEIGQLVEIGRGATDATYTRKVVFDLRSSRGQEVLVRDDGKITQAARTRTPFGITCFTGRRLAQAVGWLDFWSQWFKEIGGLLDAADALESSPAIRRIAAADGRAQLVAKLVLDSGMEFEMRYTDLPEVRLTYVRQTTPGRFEVTSKVGYRVNHDGFHYPYAFREIRRRIDQTPPRIETVDEAVVTHFSMQSPAAHESMPVIEVPDDVRVRDKSQINDSDDEEPTPSPDTN